MYALSKAGDVRMTAKEVAEVLGVTPEAIKKHVRGISARRRLYPQIGGAGIV
jgi:predicted transcriptional regulator